MSGQRQSAESVRLMSIGRQYHFSASHVLGGLPEGHPCTRLHGHNYDVEIVAEGLLDSRLMVIEFADLDLSMNKVIAELDHYHLNEVMPQPTAEAIAAWILDRTPAVVCRVRVWETPRCWAEATR